MENYLQFSFLLSFIIPIICLSYKKYDFLVFWIGFSASIEIFNNLSIVSLTSTKIAGIILIPYALKTIKKIFVYTPIKLWLLLFALLITLGLLYGLIYPWPDYSGVRSIRQLPLGRSILYLGSYFLEMMVVIFLSQNLFKTSSIKYLVVGLILAGCFNSFGILIEKYTLIDLYSQFTSYDHRQVQVFRNRGFNYEPRGAGYTGAIALLLVLALQIKMRYKACLIIIIIPGFYFAASVSAAIILSLTSLIIFFAFLIFNKKLQIGLRKYTQSLIFLILTLFVFNQPLLHYFNILLLNNKEFVVLKDFCISEENLQFTELVNQNMKLKAYFQGEKIEINKEVFSSPGLRNLISLELFHSKIDTTKNKFTLTFNQDIIMDRDAFFSKLNQENIKLLCKIYQPGNVFYLNEKEQKSALAKNFYDFGIFDTPTYNLKSVETSDTSNYNLKSVETSDTSNYNLKSAQTSDTSNYNLKSVETSDTSNYNLKSAQTSDTSNSNLNSVQTNPWVAVGKAKSHAYLSDAKTFMNYPSKYKFLQKFEMFDAASIDFFINNPKYIFLGTGPGLIALAASEPRRIDSLPHIGVLKLVSDFGIIGFIIWSIMIFKCFIILIKNALNNPNINENLLRLLTFSSIMISYGLQAKIFYIFALAIAFSSYIEHKKD